MKQKILEALEIRNVHCWICGSYDFELQDVMKLQWGEEPDMITVGCQHCGLQINFETRRLVQV